jgi:cytochrome c
MMAIALVMLLAAMPTAPEPTPQMGDLLAPVPMPESPIERRGRLVGLQCGGCHSVRPGDSLRIGPSLVGIIGARAGSRPGFHYSPAMRDSGLVWDRETLDRFLAAPAAVVPGTKMRAGALRNPSDRTAILAWLQSLDE